MKETMKDIILNASADMTESRHKTDFIVSRGERCLPDRSCIIRILKDLKRVMFPDILVRRILHSFHHSILSVTV